jgi:hypothetical protein
MKIGPLSNEQKVWAGLQKMKSRPAKDDFEQKKDTVEISQEARKKLAELADQALKRESGGKVVAGKRPGNDDIVDKAVTEEENDGEKNLSPGRQAEIRKRISTGFYDRPEIRDQIIDKLADDIDIG